MTPEAIGELTNVWMPLVSVLVMVVIGAIRSAVTLPGKYVPLLILVLCMGGMLLVQGVTRQAVISGIMIAGTASGFREWFVKYTKKGDDV